jgi:hypothetical protein
LRRECRIAPPVPVCSCAFFYVQFAHEIAGAACTRCSLRPLIFEGNFLHNSGASCREMADAYRRGCLKNQIGNLRCARPPSPSGLRRGSLRYEMARLAEAGEASTRPPSPSGLRRGSLRYDMARRAEAGEASEGWWTNHGQTGHWEIIVPGPRSSRNRSQ